VTAYVLAFILERTIGLRLSEEEQVAGVDLGDWDLVADTGMASGNGVPSREPEIAPATPAGTGPGA